MPEANPSPRPRSRTKPTLLGSSVTSPTDNTQRKEVPVRERKTVYAFYIDGAGDKRAYPPLPLPGNVLGPFSNIAEVSKSVRDVVLSQQLLKFYKYFYLGYYEIYGDDNIKKNVVAALPSKDVPIVIIGHSLGGWNGAHLSHWLNKAGYNVELLVTLDPVGQGILVTMVSDIYGPQPKVAAKQWINIRAEAQKRDSSDDIADFGEQWEVGAGPTLNVTVDVSHAYALRMFQTPINKGPSAAERVIDLIKRLTK